MGLAEFDEYTANLADLAYEDSEDFTNPHTLRGLGLLFDDADSDTE